MHMMTAENATQPAATTSPAFTQPGINVVQTPEITQTQPLLGFSSQDLSPAGSQDLFQAVYDASNTVDIPEGTDPWLADFIQLGNEAHNYSRAMRLTHNLAAPDVSQAVMVVDSH